MSFNLSAAFKERLVFTSTLYDALINAGFGKRCNKKSKSTVHHNTCAGIHGLKDAGNISGIIRTIALDQEIIRANKFRNPAELCAIAIKKAAHQVSNAETVPAQFGPHLAEALFLAKAIYQMATRAKDILTRKLVSDCNGPFPTRRNAADFGNYLEKTFESINNTTLNVPVAQLVPYTTTTDPPPTPPPSAPPKTPPVNPYKNTKRPASNDNPYASRKRARTPTGDNSSEHADTESPRNQRRDSRAEKEAERTCRAERERRREEEEEKKRNTERTRREEEAARKQAEEAATRKQRSDARAEREAERIYRAEQARRKEEEERKRHNTERARREEEAAHKQAEEASTKQQREQRRKEQKEAELREHASTRNDRIDSAHPRHILDVDEQKGYYDERALNPTFPVPAPEENPSYRYASIMPRRTPLQQEYFETKRTEYIKKRERVALLAIENATCDDELRAAQILWDVHKAHERRYPAIRYKAPENCDPCTLEAFDSLHPNDIASNYVNMPRRSTDSDVAQVAQIVGRAGALRREARDRDDDVEADQLLKLILVAPQLFLRHGSATSQAPHTRFLQFHTSKYGELIADFNADIIKAENDAADGIAPNSEATNNQNILRFISQGEFSKASRHLEDAVVLDSSDPEVLAQLKDRLGQARPRSLPGVIDDDGTPFGRVEISVRKTLRRLKPNKGTGANGVPSEFYTQMSLDRPTCDEANNAVDIAYDDLADEYLNGEAPLWFYAADAIAETLALAKSTLKLDARPISMGATLTRAFKAAAVKSAYEDTELHFSECQFGAGAKSGGHSQSIGATIAFEKLSDEGGIILLDIANAYSTTDRALGLEKIRKHPDTAIRNLYPLLLSANSPECTPKGVDITVSTGVQQGCPLSSIFFAVAIHDSLLRLRELTGNPAVAYQDDTIIPTNNLKDTLPLIEKYAELLYEDVGVRLNPSKTKIITRDADRARATLAELAKDNPFFSNFKLGCIPDADSNSVQFGGGLGAMINGTPVGDSTFVHYQVDKATNKSAAHMRRIVKRLAPQSTQATILLLRNCILPRMSHMMGSVRPAVIEPYLERLDDEIKEHFRRLTRLDTTLKYLSETELAVVEARLSLPIALGGVGLVPLKDIAKAAYVATIVQSIPRLVKRTIDFVELAAAMPQLTDWIGTDMGDTDTHRRLATFTSKEVMEKSKCATAFFIAHAHLQHQDATGLYSIRTKPDQTPALGLLSAPIEGLGRDSNDHMTQITTRLQSKLYAPILKGLVIALRVTANELPKDSKVREALTYTDAYPSTKCFIRAKPSRNGVIANVDLTTAFNQYLGCPLPICVDNFNMPLPSQSGKLKLDIYGNNLATAIRLGGNSNKTRHDNILQVTTDLCNQAGVEHTMEDINLFAPAHDPNSDSALPPIIPDLTITTSNNKKIFDVKIIGHGTSGFRTANEGEAVEKRAARVESEYRNKAAVNDRNIGSDITTGILERVGGVTGLVGGPRGETSKSFDSLTLLLADAAGKNNWRMMGAETIQDAKGVFKNLFRARLGTTIVREQSKWIRTRIEQAASEMNGAPRYGERARNQTAQSRGDQAAYAQAFAEFTRGRGEWNTGRNGNGNGNGNRNGSGSGNGRRG
ncbi:hypothetical protein TrCOL_g2030 [Triparma columacea]|uniref:Reverse transcriptase domain-containing protein n=1 Tax=Triparma columacea TaxID=722753 RepID=A0A9W7LFH8_9STRA|nr:hypothetical protein TrCOL_g2030 [Triparma columacea]